MKLVQKLTLALVLGMSAILAANGYFRVRREVAIFQTDRIRDHDLIGRSLAAAVVAVWRAEGRARALSVIDACDARGGRVRIGWRDRTAWEAAGGEGKLRVDRATLDQVATGETLTRLGRDARGEETRYSYVPIEIDGVRVGVLELSESLLVERRYLHTTIFDTVAATLTLAVLSSGLSVFLGFWLVGKPVGLLAEKARRIGLGDFGGEVKLAGRDELSALGDEMNAMGERLTRAHEQVAQETHARIATLEQLRHADRLSTVGKLASGVAHELGTPLNVVLARAMLIRSGDVTGDEVIDSARIIEEASRRMTLIIRQLLAFARRKGPQRSARELRKIVADTLELLRPLLAKRRAIVEFAEGAPCWASVDAGQIEQAVTNLVVNAAQAMPSGGKVTLTLQQRRATPPADQGGAPGEFLCLQVRDQGTGISPEHLPHLFEPFFTTKDVGEGTGLGLSVTYGILQEHGGFISVESALDTGSVFSLYLPAVEPS